MKAVKTAAGPSYLRTAPSYQVYRLGAFLGVVVTPGLAPEPLLRQRLNGDLVNHVVGQILKGDERFGALVRASGSFKV